MKAFTFNDVLLMCRDHKHKRISMFFALIIFVICLPTLGLAQCDLVITDPASICYPATVDLTSPDITAGSPADLTLTYWEDSTATIALTNPDAVATSGTYYIRGEATDGCFDIKAVTVVYHRAPSLLIHDPASICYPATVDLTSPDITAGSDAGLVYTYWINPVCTNALTNPSRVITSGTYYIMAGTAEGCFVVMPVNVRVDPEITPTFVPIGPLCQYETELPLPITSPEGVTGTWSPGNVRTGSAGIFTFTFTPDPGYCAFAVTMEIIIDHEIVPSFNPIGPLDQNEAEPPLPPTSLNGITGIWDPATINTAIAGIFTFTFTPDSGQCTIPLVMGIIINPATSIEQEPYITVFELHPNPNNGTFNINYQSSHQCLVELSILDITGKVIYSQVYPNTGQPMSEMIQLNKNLPGVYFVRLISDTKVFYKKIFVQ